MVANGAVDEEKENGAVENGDVDEDKAEKDE